ncbi:hypothetical protein BOTBODRAFT_31815 [Botryobasidium botryosum FD-172 SS1]|uniref:NADAR domain-containing protein n=1 Tax=Botryobasidium botryosum (strain FD-172 SS1) TaxID=930990 RepID=A0A067MIX9_BOTB1|nr:hypothetical protein BOTBODRAFT_31815 [Botryobasidium botryosum FD-172 SS1]
MGISRFFGKKPHAQPVHKPKLASISAGNAGPYWDESRAWVPASLPFASIHDTRAFENPSYPQMPLFQRRHTEAAQQAGWPVMPQYSSVTLPNPNTNSSTRVNNYFLRADQPPDPRRSGFSLPPSPVFPPNVVPPDESDSEFEDDEEYEGEDEQEHEYEHGQRPEQPPVAMEPSPSHPSPRRPSDSSTTLSTKHTHSSPGRSRSLSGTTVLTGTTRTAVSTLSKGSNLPKSPTQHLTSELFGPQPPFLNLMTPSQPPTPQKSPFLPPSPRSADHVVPHPGGPPKLDPPVLKPAPPPAPSSALARSKSLIRSLTSRGNKDKDNDRVIPPKEQSLPTLPGLGAKFPPSTLANKKHYHARSQSLSALTALAPIKPLDPDGYILSRPQRFLFDSSEPFSGFVMSSSHCVLYKKKLYPTAEHLLQAHRFLKNKGKVAEEVRTCSRDPKVALRFAMSKCGEQRKDWDQIKLGKLEEVVYLKFTQHPELREQLVVTHPADLAFHSPGDTYWGVDDEGKGRNEVGKALMKVRDRLKREGML